MRNIHKPSIQTEGVCTPELEDVSVGPPNLPPGASVEKNNFFDRFRAAPFSIQLCILLMLLMALTAVFAP